MKILTPYVVASALAVVACSQEAEPVDPAELAESEAKPAEEGEKAALDQAAKDEEKAEAMSPVAVCEGLVAASKEGDAAKFGEHATSAAKEAMAKSEEVAKEIMDMIGQATCGEAKIDKQKAMVSVAIGDKTRDIPFAQVEGAWKFDGEAYMATHQQEKAEAPKKGRRKGKRLKKRGG